MMDTKLPEARLPQEFILDAFADPSSVRDVVRGKPLYFPRPIAFCNDRQPNWHRHMSTSGLIMKLHKGAEASY